VVEPSPAHEQSSETGPVVLPKPVRVQLWSAAWAMFSDYPVLGVGADNFHVRFGDYSGVPESKLGTHAHSMYLESLADTGVVGLLALVWLLVTVLRLAIEGLLSEPDRDVWILRAALLASLVAWLVHGVLDDLQRFWPAGLAFWIIVGLIARGRTFTAASER
jgi:putative inorganic carbon (hco3(-)) transporter